MGMALKPYLQLMRPANIMTAISDVFAGAAIAILYTGSGAEPLSWEVLAWLSLATIGLYGGGVVFNDVFDAKLDAVERPERPIPSGQVSVFGAACLGIGLFAMGILAALATTTLSAIIAAAIVVMCLVYDRWAKHYALAGPVAMGLCRGLNLMLGMTYLAGSLPDSWFLAVIPVVYIAAVTTISRDEVHGGNRFPLVLSAALYAAVIAAITYFGVLQSRVILGYVLVAVFALFVYKPLFRAIKTLAASDVRTSVKHGVLGLVFMNAVWTSAAGEWVLPVIVLLLFPLSIWLAKVFAVT